MEPNTCLLVYPRLHPCNISHVNSTNCSEIWVLKSSHPTAIQIKSKGSYFLKDHHATIQYEMTDCSNTIDHSKYACRKLINATNNPQKITPEFHHKIWPIIKMRLCIVYSKQIGLKFTEMFTESKCYLRRFCSCSQPHGPAVRTKGSRYSRFTVLQIVAKSLEGTALSLGRWVLTRDGHNRVAICESGRIRNRRFFRTLQNYLCVFAFMRLQNISPSFQQALENIAKSDRKLPLHARPDEKEDSRNWREECWS